MTQTLMTQAASNTDGSSQTEATKVAATTEAAKAAPATETKEVSNQQAETKEPQAQAEAKVTEVKEAPIELKDFAAPEGVKLDAEAATEFKTVAKELGLKQENAQKVFDVGVKLMQKWEARQAEAAKAANAAWIESTKADKEFGGEALDQNLAVAKKALDTFGTPELRTLLNESGLGNHPEIVRAFYRAGKAISEDRFVSGNRGPAKTGDRDFAKSLYP
ncbi:protease, partial [bacterium]|nr:protease [bacterium]